MRKAIPRSTSMLRVILVRATTAALIVGSSAGHVAASDGAGWTAAVNLEAATGSADSLNTSALEGCPSQSRNGLDLYFASNRPGGYGNLDIYVSHRPTTGAPWGPPQNLGPTINTAGREFCPTPTRDGHGLLFVSDGRSDTCGGSDIYISWQDPTGWETPRDLGCQVNSAADEASPFLLPDDHGGEMLYFSSNRGGGFDQSDSGAVSGDWDIYMASVTGNQVAPATLVPGVNTKYDDVRPNLRRDGLELFFDSNRPGGCGSYDIWTATRSANTAAWSDPADLPCTVNSSAADMRASISWDGTTLIFGSARAGGEGSSDLWMSTRPPVFGN